MLSEVTTETIEEEEGDDFDRKNVLSAREVEVDELEEEEEARSDALTLSSRDLDMEGE